MKPLKLLQGIAVSVVAFGFAASVQAADVFKFAHVYEIDHPLHKSAVMAAEEIAKLTDGRVEIKVYPSSSLGKETALNEGLSLGTVDIIFTGGGFAGSTYGPISMSDYPFTLRGVEHWKSYRDSDLFKEMAAGYKDATGDMAEVAAFSYYGARHVTANKAILKPEDMKNLKIRVPNAPSYVLFPKAVGANPTPMAFSEVYLALQQGVVDAQENPLTTIQAKKFYEVQSDISLTGHISNSILTLVSSMKLKKLSDEDRAALLGVLKSTAAWSSDQIIQAEQELAEWFREKGITVSEVDRAPFMAMVKPALTEKGMPFTPEMYERLQALPGN